MAGLEMEEWREQQFFENREKWNRFIRTFMLLEDAVEGELSSEVESFMPHDKSFDFLMRKGYVIQFENALEPGTKYIQVLLQYIPMINAGMAIVEEIFRAVMEYTGTNPFEKLEGTDVYISESLKGIKIKPEFLCRTNQGLLHFSFDLEEGNILVRDSVFENDRGRDRILIYHGNYTPEEFRDLLIENIAIFQ